MTSKIYVKSVLNISKCARKDFNTAKRDWIKTNGFSEGVCLREKLKEKGYKRIPRLQPYTLKDAKKTDLYKFLKKNKM